MKRFILFTLLLLGVMSIHAYHPLVEEGKIWKYDSYEPSRPSEYNFFYSYYLSGDTTIAEHNCLKLYSENSNNDNKTIYIGALYETNKKVYFIVPNDERPHLLYDFDCNIGDTLNILEGTMIVADFHVEYQETLPINVVVVYSTELGEGFPIKWIEGVGCVNDFFSMIPNPGNYSHLLSCVSNGQYLYQYKRPPSTEKGYHKMAIEGKTWNYIHHYVDEEGEHDEPYCYIVKGDTLLQERFTYKKLYRQDASGERYVGTILEDGRDVYMLYAGTTVLRCLYDFGRDDFGRVFDWESKYGRGRVYWMLNTIDTIQVRGQDFRRLIALQRTIKGGTPKQLSTIEDGEDVWHDIWIEGVGSQYSGIEAPIHEVQPDSDYTYFVSCYENGKCIFTAADFTTAIRALTAQPAAKDSSFKIQVSGSNIYDLQGRRLSAPPAKGIYIENGKVKSIHK